jgi:hypothetical protein
VSMWRVTTIIGGPYVQGGGIQQFYFDQAGGTAAQAQTAVKNFWNAFISSIGSGTTFAVNAAIESVSEPTGDILSVTAGTAGTTSCTGGTTVLPMQVQGLLQLRSGVYLDGREVRGRVNIPALISTANAGGVPTSSIQTTIAGAGAALIADSVSTVGIYRRERLARTQVGTKGSPGYLSEQTHRDGVFEPASSATASTKWATLRTRRD